MRAVITPAPLRGEIKSIASKSRAHRVLICAALAEAPSLIRCGSRSGDIDATVDCLRALGAEIEYKDGAFSVIPIKTPVQNAELDCGESGSTLRFLLPVVCALGCGARIKMHGRLPERPLSPLWEELERCGACLWRPERDTVAVDGRLTERSFAIDAGVSSQNISGLLFALAILGEGRLELRGRIESAGYIDMTLQALAEFGAVFSKEGNSYSLAAGSALRSPGETEVEGDWSNAAFWLVASVLSGDGLCCTGLDPDSAQGDRAVIEAIAAIRAGNATIDAANIPDLVPVLAVLSALTPGSTEFINAGRLRIKESDRLATVAELITALGGNIEELPEGLAVRGQESLRGGKCHSRGDHRIAMSAAVAAIGCRETVTIENAESVEKSYPAFWRDYAALGGKLELED